MVRANLGHNIHLALVPRRSLKVQSQASLWSQDIEYVLHLPQVIAIGRVPIDRKYFVASLHALGLGIACRPHSDYITMASDYLILPAIIMPVCVLWREEKCVRIVERIK